MFIIDNTGNTEIAVPEKIQKLLESCTVLDEKFKNDWTETQLEEKIYFYQNTKVHIIFEKIGLLQHWSGYSLVRSSFFIIIRNVFVILVSLIINNLQIQADFCAYFKKSQDLFYQNWYPLAESIIKYTTGKKKYTSIINKNKATEKGIFCLYSQCFYA